MQNWLPDEFMTSDATATAVFHGDTDVFEPENKSKDVLQNDIQRLFMSESGFSGPDAIMGHLTREERAQVFELVEQDIKTEYEEREIELRAKMAAELKEARIGFDETLTAWTGKLHKAMATHMKEVSDSSARLAIQVAEKIVRQKILVDKEILIRAIETTLYKMDGTKDVTINLNPSQAEWLESLPEMKEKLGINQIISDRRVEPGGCLIKTEKQEWDVTVAGQLNYLSELVEEMITTADEPGLTGEEGTDAEPSME